MLLGLHCNLRSAVADWVVGGGCKASYRRCSLPEYALISTSDDNMYFTAMRTRKRIEKSQTSTAHKAHAFDFKNISKTYGQSNLTTAASNLSSPLSRSPWKVGQDPI